MLKKTDLPRWMLTLAWTVAFAFHGMPAHAADADATQGAVRPSPISAQGNDDPFSVGDDVTTTATAVYPAALAACSTWSR